LTSILTAVELIRAIHTVLIVITDVLLLYAILAIVTLKEASLARGHLTGVHSLLVVGVEVV